ncbi:MAG: PepSY domain-containing protein [Bacteriovoracia bacterium]
MNRKIYWLHKHLALVFSLPLLLMAISGFIITLAPEGERPPELAPASVAKIFESAISKSEKIQIARLMMRGPGGSQPHLMVSENDQRKLIWLENDEWREKILSDDFFYLNKHFHEGFLIPGIGKKIVAVSGLGLFFIVLSGCLFWLITTPVWTRTKRLWLERRARLSTWHILLGLLLGIPLLFQSITGSLIELNSLIWSDQPSITHEKPASCSIEEQKNLLTSLESEVTFAFLCRPGEPYVWVRTKSGTITRYTPTGVPVMSYGAEKWQGSALTRKGYFVGLHEGKFLGEWHHLYNRIMGLALLFFTLSGLWIWLKKRLARK